MSCPSCPNVPVISEGLSRRILASIPITRRAELPMIAMQWMVKPHPELKVYVGVQGREYTTEEKMAVALETGLASSLECPFYIGGNCVIDSELLSRPDHIIRSEEWHQAPYGWLPMWVARAWAKNDLSRFLARGWVADVKVTLLTRNEVFMSPRDASGAVHVV